MSGIREAEWEERISFHSDDPVSKGHVVEGAFNSGPVRNSGLRSTPGPSLTGFVTSGRLLTFPVPSVPGCLMWTVILTPRLHASHTGKALTAHPRAHEPVEETLGTTFWKRTLSSQPGAMLLTAEHSKGGRVTFRSPFCAWGFGEDAAFLF